MRGPLSVPYVCRCSTVCRVTRVPRTVRRVYTVHAYARQVYSETYRVPVLLLQGYGDDGRPWRGLTLTLTLTPTPTPTPTLTLTLTLTLTREMAAFNREQTGGGGLL